jgi:ATP synthase protein I
VTPRAGLSSRPRRSRELPGLYFRWAAVPTVVVTGVAALVALLAEGGAEALGVALGGLVVLVFFGIDLLAMRVSARWEPTTTFLLVMVEYLAKIIALAVLFAAIRGQDSLPGRSVGIGIAVAATVFLAALVAAYLKIPTFVVEPEDERAT